MTPAAAHDVITAFLVFCRVGTSVMVLPGLSGGRIPPAIRLFLSIALTFAMLPAVDRSTFGVPNGPGAMLAVFVIGEVIVGLFMGFLVRIYYIALEFAAVAMANFAGFGSIFMQAIDDNSSTTAFSELVTLPSLALFFILDLHVAVFDLMRQTYDIVSVGQWIGKTMETSLFVDAFRQSFQLTLQASAPLMLYALTLNLVLGLLSKLVPQVPIYFVSTPFLIVGGLLMLMETDGMILTGLASSVTSWIAGLASHG